MSVLDIAIKGATVVLPSGPAKVGVGVADGVIAVVCEDEWLPEARLVLDGTGKILAPGFIDPHVHIRGDHPDREDFYSGTAAAACGGVTTVLEMPVCMPPTNTADILVQRAREASRQALVDFSLYGGAGEDNLDEIKDLADAGAIAFKSFMHPIPSGREREFAGLCMSDDGSLLSVFEEVAKTGLAVAVHAEDHGLIRHFVGQLKYGTGGLMLYEQSQPVIAELAAVERALFFARRSGVRLVLCHVSTPEAVEVALEAKTSGQDVIIETCPHYILFSAEELDDAGAFGKVKPPIRREATRRLLHACFVQDKLDFVGSDHAPFTRAEKECYMGDIFAAPSGLPGIELTLPLLLTEVSQGLLGLHALVKLFSERAARVFGLYPRKGCIVPGADADLVLIDPLRRTRVKTQSLATRSRESAVIYEGREMTGLPVLTMVRGNIVMENGTIVGKPGTGKFLRRDDGPVELCAR